ncbi:MAG TPA: glucose-6-phosphate dehydrogenase [Thermoanaerobaculia bacterium]|nr:glucose-6-phosphate dehydrogenase [Thermoanaerobaculia bacterium]
MTVAPPENVLEPNPLREGLEQERVPDASALVIFGASGDLTARKLVPALYSLAHDGLLPAGQAIIGFARPDYTDDAFRMAMRESCEKFARTRPIDEAIWESFARRLFYVRGEFGEPEAYNRLKQKLDECDKNQGTGGRRIYYLAVPPNFFPIISEILGAEGMVADPERSGPYTRVIIEKPFGHDLASARELNRVAVTTFRERQVFRIDHYLGKETVQNLLVLRFANGIFEPFWNRQYIDHVQFTVAEAIGVEKRGNYFETAGITRDIVQNHMLQLVSLVAMEPPVAMEANAVRDEKVKVLRALREFPSGREEELAVRGQYSEGSVLGSKAPAYRNEENVNPESKVETFAAMKVFVDNWRWADVPFYLRAGKRLPKRVTDISIHFRPAPYPLFNKMQTMKMQPNVLAIRIQPDEGISLRFDSKVPGPTVRTAPVTMEFRYATSFGAEPPEAYERLLLETMLGDSTLFARRDEVETAWAWLDPLLKAWTADPRPPAPYAAGTWGPPEADALIERDGRKWRRS